MSYLKNVIIALDQLVNALTGGNPDETISSRIGKAIRAGGFMARLPWPAWALDHFLGSIEEDEA